VSGQEEFLLELQGLEDLIVAGNAVPAAGMLAARKLIATVIDTYDRLYERLCGRHPHRRMWHSQWLMVKDIYRDLDRLLPTLRGEVLDVGCLGKPYASWLRGADRHIGIDVAPGPSVDFVIKDGEPWPFDSGRFQSAICTQVFQVVPNPDQLIAELHRVLAPGGIAVVTTPFCYHDMSVPLADGGVYGDLWRHSIYGAEMLLSKRFEVLEIRRQGGIGSTVGGMSLNWIRISATRSLASHLAFVLMLPLWIPFCFAVNTLAWVLDRLDWTTVFYFNVLAVVRKKP
jgi:SAM-dependent methyltransferase